MEARQDCSTAVAISEPGKPEFAIERMTKIKTAMVNRYQHSENKMP
jgi:hypothetical protein